MPTNNNFNAHDMERSMQAWIAEFERLMHEDLPASEREKPIAETVREKMRKPQEQEQALYNELGLIRVWVIDEASCICPDDHIKIRITGSENELTERAALVTKLDSIFARNKVSAIVQFVTSKEVDTMEAQNQFKPNDFVVVIVDRLNPNIDDHGNSAFAHTAYLGTGEYSVPLSSDSGSNYARPVEGNILMFWQNIIASRPGQEGANEYLLLNEDAFFDFVSKVVAHEIYHNIIYRSIRYQLLAKEGIKYVFNQPHSEKTEGLLKGIYKNTDLFDKGAHQPSTNNMWKRRKRYSLNSTELGYIPWIRSWRKTDSEGSPRHISVDAFVTAFFTNRFVDLKSALREEQRDYYRDNVPSEIIGALTGKYNFWDNLEKKWYGPIYQGCAAESIYLFREDLQDKYVKPFLKTFNT